MTNRDNREPKRQDIYEEFVLWSAMPPSERFKLGIETQEQFTEFYDIGINTPTAWKRRPEFETRVTILRREWAFGRTSAVIEGIYRSAIKGNPFSQKLWLQYFLGFTEKSEVDVTNSVNITPTDIRFLIEALPEPLKTKHYANLRELLDDSVAHANAQNIDVQALDDAADLEISDLSEWSVEAVPGPTDYDAPYLSSLRADAVAMGDPSGLRSDMGDYPDGAAPPSTHHNQSAARWW